MLDQVGCLDNSDCAADVENDMPLMEAAIDTSIVSEEEPKETENKLKKKKSRDDTEQPIYPCEECTACFTTATDRKVLLFVLFIFHWRFVF